MSRGRPVCGLCAEYLPCPCLGKLRAEQAAGTAGIPQLRERRLRNLQLAVAEATRKAEASRQLRRDVRKCVVREPEPLWQRALKARGQ